MLINEIFYSLQGEGVHMGKASIFIRLSRCNLRCSFCDTEFDSGTEMTIEALREAIAPYPGRRIIWTGGDVHLYNNHFDQAREQLSRTPYPLPTLALRQAASIDSYHYDDIQLQHYHSHPPIKAPVAV